LHGSRPPGKGQKSADGEKNPARRGLRRHPGLSNFFPRDTFDAAGVFRYDIPPLTTTYAKNIAYH
jgi:hypothetical protein